MKPLIPTIFAHNKKEFQERFNKLLPVSKNIQIDLMDGKFVPAKSVSLSQIPNLKKYKNNFEAHLMVLNPEKYLTKLKQKGFKKIIFHIETKDPEKTFDKITKLNLDAWLAINPPTNLKNLEPFLNKSKGVLFMGIKPGKERRKFIPKIYKKIKTFHKLHPKIKIQVDGGVNLKTISKLKNSGVDYVNSGSFISNAKNPKDALKKLHSIFRKV